MDEGDGANRCGGEGEDEWRARMAEIVAAVGVTSQAAACLRTLTLAVAETRVESGECAWLRSAGCSLSSWDSFSPGVRPNASRRSPLLRLRLPPRLRRRRPRRSQRQRPRCRTTSSGCSGPPSTYAATLQAYRDATARVEQQAATRKAGTWAVILDADETVISNLQYQIERIGQGYSAESWAAWVHRKEATPLPGAARVPGARSSSSAAGSRS